MAKDYSPTDIRGNERRKAETDDKRKTDRAQEVEDFLWVMGNERGQRFMWRLLGMTGVFRNPFTGNSETFFRCGEQNIGQQLIGEIHTLCPEKYIDMVNANRKVNT